MSQNSNIHHRTPHRRVQYTLKTIREKLFYTLIAVLQLMVLSSGCTTANIIDPKTCTTELSKMELITGSVHDDYQLHPLINEKELHQRTLINAEYLFTNSNRNGHELTTALSRAGLYISTVKRILQTKGMPEELAWLPILESDYFPYAVSPAGATGLWQLMKGTAKDYGLKVDKHVDERRDPEKSTIAAAKYLKSLYHIFGNWKLVVMGYNAGKHRIAELHALSQKKGIDILNNDKCPNETYYYPHYFVTILKIVSNPEDYGYAPITEKPWLLNYTTVEIKKKISLKTLAQKHGVTVAEIKKINPALLGSYTPPYKYSVRIPTAPKFRV